LDIAGAEGFHSPEGNMCGTVMRGADTPRGQRPHHVQRDRGVIRTKQVSRADYPDTVLGGLTKLGAARSIVAVPMLKEDALLGATGGSHGNPRPASRIHCHAGVTQRDRAATHASSFPSETLHET